MTWGEWAALGLLVLIALTPAVGRLRSICHVDHTSDEAAAFYAGQKFDRDHSGPDGLI